MFYYFLIIKYLYIKYIRFMRRFIVKRQQTKRLQKRFVSNDSHVVENNVNALETVPQIENVKDIITPIQSDTNDTDDVKKVSNNKIKKEKQQVMDTKEKIQMAAEILDSSDVNVKKITKEKGLIERTESSKTIITEDNRELLRG